MTEEDILLRKQLLSLIKEFTRDYMIQGDRFGVMKPRDIGCLVNCYAKLIGPTTELLARQSVELKGEDRDARLEAIKKDLKFFENELRFICKRAALAMGAMEQKTRLYIATTLADIDYYDKDLTEAMI